MKFKLITSWTCLVALLMISSLAFAVPVSVGPAGVTFPDNSVQSSAAVLPGCASGGVLVNNSGAWFCGKILPVDKGIATCVDVLCTVSACQPTFADCDGGAANGCEIDLTTTQNCGACGITCAVGDLCTAGTCVTAPDPNKPASIVLTTSSTPGVINNNVPVTLTATVTPTGPNGTLANGTPVTFTIQSGTGTLTGGGQTAIANTTNGVATVTLNSTVVGSVGVSATAGSAPLVTSNTVTVPFINQPTQAIVVLQTAGAIPVTNPITAIGAIGTDVTFPTNKGLTFVSANISGPVTSSGFNPAVDVNGDPVPPFTTSLMTSNLFSAGVVRMALISAANPPDPAVNALITTTGRFATVRFSIAAGNFPIAADFGISNTTVDVAGITVQIQSVTLQ